MFPIHATPRGWRRLCALVGVRSRDVSIHATLAGWRHNAYPHYRHRGTVSIHATLAGGGGARPRRARRQTISIHATPRGWRYLNIYCRLLPAAVFLSTPPSRVATCTPPLTRHQESFYPRHPRGWRRSTGRAREAAKSFIHATLAGGDRACCVLRRLPLVSIHATLAGGDILRFRYGHGVQFLSTPPSRVATPRLRRFLRPDKFYPRHPRGWHTAK